MSRLTLVLVAPRIPVNVGSCLRTAAGLKAELVLVGPLGFIPNHKGLRRTSVGYWDEMKPTIYRDSDHFWNEFPSSSETQWILATKFSKKRHDQITYGDDVVLLFGNEEEGIIPEFLEAQKRCNSGRLAAIQSCRIPMGAIRCLNLSVSVGVCGYEVARQWGWKTLECQNGLEGSEELTEKFLCE